MKRASFVILFLTFVITSNSQITKGNWMLGGNIYFETNKSGPNESFKTTTFSASPNVGFFFIDKLAGGIRGSLQTYKEQDGNLESKYNTLLVGPLLRYYFLNLEQPFNLLLETNYQFGSTKAVNGESFSNSQLNFLGGPAFFLNSSVAIELLFGYRVTNFEGNDSREKGFNVNVGFQIHLERE